MCSGLLFVPELAQKLYKILHTLSVGLFQNAGDTPITITELKVLQGVDSEICGTYIEVHMLYLEALFVTPL
ncbi:hypothetical protein [Bacillus cereus]|uniref:hypothetical protein n=1 Tax=Bacillus cereus TaxID=1396 RepID=UPI0009F6790C|nr:hypothetical protein [Bacillus cereus]RCL16061.1 hypothetical protein BLO02_017060 [Bacillus cereus]